jgi:DNA adenine methylase
VKFKVKFLLSSYPSTILNSYIKKYKWRVHKIVKSVAVTKHTDKKKTELFVMNYDPSNIKHHIESPTIKNISVKKLESQLHRLKFTA